MTTPGPDHSNPYVGPRSFRRDETLYGRDREAQKLLNLLIAERIVLLYSPSGAGKTSLMQAMLIPKLEQEGFKVRPVMRVSHAPPPEELRGIAVGNRYILGALLSLEEDLPDEQETPLAELTNTALVNYLGRRWPEPEEPDDEVLIFDQFEEILTLDPTDREAKANFFAQVGAALRNERRWALFAMREDHVASLDPYLRPIPTRLSTRFRLDLLQEEAALQAIRNPAAVAGVEFDPTAAHKLFQDLSRVRVQRLDGQTELVPGLYVEPVQLQVVCHRLWERLPAETRYIQDSDIARVGDVDTALAGYYADRVAQIAAQTGVSERAIREWFDRHLITEQELRGQVLQGPGRSQGLENRAIARLIDVYLVRKEERRGATWFELSHDRLIEPIRANNRAWREANLSTLQRQAALWESQDRPDGLLLRDEALIEAEHWAADHADDLTTPERDFLDKCREARALAQREQQQVRRLRVLAIIASVIGVVAIIALIVALIFYTRSEQQKRLATSRELAALALNNLNVDPERSVLLALQAVSTTYAVDQTVPNESEDALQRAVQASRAQLTLAGHANWVNDVVFSPDGTRIATASADGTTIVWDAASGNALRTLDNRVGWVLEVAFSPDGTYLATAHGDKTAKIWDVSSGSQRLSITGHSDTVFGVAFSPDGTRLATASWDRTAKVWDVASGHELLTLVGHGDQVKRVTFSPDGRRIVTTSNDKTARVWDAVSGKSLLTLAGHTSQLYEVAFSPDGTRIATASDDRTARLWDASSGKQLLAFSGHTNSVHGVTFSPDGTRLTTASIDGTIKVWEAVSGRLLLTLTGHSNPVDAVAYSPDGTRLASASRDRTAKVWYAVVGHTAAVTGVAFSPDGTRVATAGDDRTARVWDAISGRELLILSGHAERVKDVAFSPDGTRIATASDDRTARVWDAASGKPLLTFSGHAGFVTVVAFNPDGTQLATAGVDRTAKVWDAHTGKPLLTLTGHTDWISGIAFSPDGTRLVTASGDRTVRIWDVASGSALLKLDTGRVRGVALSSDGAYLATANEDGTTQVWNAISGKELLTLSGHSNVVHGVAFSPDASRVATASWDRTVIIWDVASGTELRTLNHSAEVYRVAFSPDGTRLATTGPDHKLNIYHLNIDDLMALARMRLTRPFTSEECQRFLHREPCPPMP